VVVLAVAVTVALVAVETHTLVPAVQQQRAKVTTAVLVVGTPVTTKSMVAAAVELELLGMALVGLMVELAAQVLHLLLTVLALLVVAVAVLLAIRPTVERITVALVALAVAELEVITTLVVQVTPVLLERLTLVEVVAQAAVTHLKALLVGPVVQVLLLLNT
jgi:hypothetical protein